MSQNRRLSVFSVAFVLVALTLALMFSCSDQPTAIDKDKDDGLGGTGELDPGASGRFLIGEVVDTSLGTGTLEVWAMNAAFNETTGIATFDVQILNGTQSSYHLPVCFMITSIRPDDIAVVDFDGIMAGAPYYNISEALGGGNVLKPGESSAPVTMKFHTVTPRSFAIGFHFGASPVPLGTIAGVVFLDADKDGAMNRSCRCEPGIPGIIVALQKTLPGGRTVEFIAGTDSSGAYEFKWLKEGVYKLFVTMIENRYLVTSPNPLLITLIKGTDGKVQDFLGADFGLFLLNPPPNPVARLFGPVIIGPPTPFGTELDSTFVNPPSPLTVIYKYYLEVNAPAREMCFGFNVVDSAEAWINDKMAFMYRRENPDDTIWAPYRFERRVVELPDSVMITGENTIRLMTDGDECAALEWKVFKAVP
jgi:hypothetical protein